MAYESFTLNSLKEQFGITFPQTFGAYDTIAPIQPTNVLTQVLKRHISLVVGRTSEKARSEFLVAPILTEVREILQEQIMVFSGIKFDVDRKAGLFGYCDYLLTKDPMVDELNAPVVVVGEAKKEDISAGLPQCVAEMIAAQRFNENRGKPLSPIYGTVTDGTRWRFLQLTDAVVQIDIKEYTLSELPQILGILTHMAS